MILLIASKFSKLFLELRKEGKVFASIYKPGKSKGRKIFGLAYFSTVITNKYCKCSN